VPEPFELPNSRWSGAQGDNPFDFAQGDTRTTFAPIDLLDYIYAVLHSPTYRETYKEFLKIDFPRVPYPDDVEKFWKLVQLAGDLRSLHLMESPSLNDYITEYPEGGDNEVEKPRFELKTKTDLPGFENLEGLGKVYINSEQYFDSVPEVAWKINFSGRTKSNEKTLRCNQSYELPIFFNSG